MYQTPGTVPALGPHALGKHGACPSALSMEKAFKIVGGFTAKTWAKTADYLGTVAKGLLKYHS